IEYSMTFLARGVWGSLPMVTMSGPAWTIFSTSRRILRRSMSRFFRTLAATPEPSLTRPRRMCSVPMYSWLNRCASWLASCITLRARSVKRSYMATPSGTGRLQYFDLASQDQHVLLPEFALHLFLQLPEEARRLGAAAGEEAV